MSHTLDNLCTPFPCFLYWFTHLLSMYSKQLWCETVSYTMTHWCSAFHPTESLGCHSHWHFANTTTKTFNLVHCPVEHFADKFPFNSHPIKKNGEGRKVQDILQRNRSEMTLIPNDIFWVYSLYNLSFMDELSLVSMAICNYHQSLASTVKREREKIYLAISEKYIK